MKILGHRGCIYEVENTIKSFEKAFELGADGIELDTQSTADGVIVVSHDENLKRLIGYDFHINEHTIFELSSIKIDGASIPTLESALELAKSKNKMVDVELKNPKDLTKVAHIVKSFNYDGFFISSFFHDAMFEGKKLFPQLKFAYLYIHKPRDISQYAKEVDFLKPHIEYLTEEYKEFSAITIPWTVNEKSDFELAKKLNVFAIITDVVDVILKFNQNSKEEESPYIAYLKASVVKEESDFEKGVITFINRIANLTIEGIYLNGKLIELEEGYPIAWSVSKKFTLNLGKLSKDDTLSIKIKEVGTIKSPISMLLT